jgi:starch synthase
MRPWKAEQLGGGYAVSTFCEQTALEHADAVIAVSQEHSRDLFASYPAVAPERVTVIYNGIDTEEYAPDPRTDVLERHGIDPRLPSVVFVGRITRQKGVPTRRRSPPRSRPRSNASGPSVGTSSGSSRCSPSRT